VCLKRLQHHPSPPNLRSTCGILNQCNYGTKRLGCAIWQLQNTRNRVVGVQLTRLTWLPRYRTVAHGLVIAVGSGGPTSGQHRGRVPPLPHHLATPLYYYQNHNQDLHTSHSHLQFNPRTYFFTFPALPVELFRQEAPKKTNLVLPLLTLVSAAWQQRSKASAGTSRDDRVCRQKTAGE
jgi:hypothetical protein